MCCKFLIAVWLSRWIVIVLFDGITKRSERTASSSVRLVSAYGFVLALKFILVFVSQIQPMPDLIFGVRQSLIEPSV